MTTGAQATDSLDRVVLVLTATVDPGVYASSLVRSDPVVRRQDYLFAIRYWQQYPDARIAGVVFCDNSGADLDDLRRECAADAGARPVEILGFNGNDQPEGMHYGYAELGTLDHVLAHSALLGRADHFVKVTGRLVFPRLTRLLDTHGRGVLVSADCRRAYAAETGPRLRVRTQLMIFETAFYRRHLQGRRLEMVGRFSHIEEFLAAMFDPWRGRPGVILRWRVECPPLGVGGNGQDFGSWPVATKAALREWLRRLAPSIWW